MIHIGRPVVAAGRHAVAQTELAAAMRRRLEALEGTDELRKMVGFIYEHSSIVQRHLELGLDELEAREDWYLAVNEATMSLARRALERLFEQHQSDELDAMVVVSSSFAGFPSLSRRLQDGMGLRLDAPCYDLAGLGCAGPTHGLHLADMLVRTGAARRVCLLCVDAMGTHGESRVHHQAPTISQVVAHCLASDGAAAVLVSAEPLDGPGLGWEDCRLRSKLWPDSLGENDFTASADNQPFIAVGKAIRTRIVEELGPVINGPDLDPDTALFHPGGAALMRALAMANPQLAPSLAISSGVLEQRGNIGSGSVLWVLHDAWAAGRPLGPRLRLIALGPGIVSTMLCLDGVEVR
ncbi:hypothetical protein G6O69_06795 [Pseudenhygromyxa sp. WMMC2535]|uniref:hypothetical protein n=1 Tax=Pseudenhygromyxa sp. WMMC2535 TaxID=2712867 RepID=UPI001558173B|nr:hypothetical protein [Pseudenhygromyxa sp. WMMC2535]